jgi:hypothetical protein
MQMRSWQFAPSYPADALIESFVRLSIPQPHSLIGQLLQAPDAKHVCEIPIPSLASRLDPDVCLLNDELSSSSSLRNGAYALIWRSIALGKSGTKTCIMPDTSTRLVWRLRHQYSESILARPIRKAAQYFKATSMRHETST